MTCSLRSWVLLSDGQRLSQLVLRLDPEGTKTIVLDLCMREAICPRLDHEIQSEWPAAG